MSIWSHINALKSRVSGNVFANIVESVRTIFEGDPETRARVAFSIAMIALSAKMAKADGVVTEEETRAFRDIFYVPDEEFALVSRVYNMAKQDVAGYETYARQMASLCGDGTPGCPVAEDILDGLFHIASADGFIHEKEVEFLQRVGEIFGFNEHAIRAIMSRHVDLGDSDPYTVLGVERGLPFSQIKRHYHDLVRKYHPDYAIARGMPEEFIAIATTRLSAINSAYEAIEGENSVRS